MNILDKPQPSKTINFSSAVLIEIGKHLDVLNSNNQEEDLLKFFNFLNTTEFASISNKVRITKQISSYNYSLKFLYELLKFTNMKIEFKSKAFKYNYSDNMVAQEFGIKRNIMLYLKKSHLSSYQVLCDAYSYRASTLSTVYAKENLVKSKNESIFLLNKCKLAIYRGGDSYLGFSSIVQTLKNAGIRGYKTHASITRAFSMNTAKISYIEDIVNAYGLEWKILKSKSEEIKDNIDSSSKLSEELLIKTVEELYETKYKDFDGLRLKSVNINNIDKVIKEAIAFRKNTMT